VFWGVHFTLLILQLTQPKANMKKIFIATFLIHLLLGCQSAFAQPVYFATQLPFIPKGINSIGEVVGFSGDGGNYLAYKWSQGSTTILGSGIAYGINDNGDVVGTSNNRAALWKADGQFVDIGAGGFQGGAARAINNLGQVVGDFGSNNELGIYTYGATSFKYSGGVINLYVANIGTATRSYAYATNDLGNLAGVENVSYDPATPYAYDSGNLNGSLANSVSYGINNNGITVGITSPPGGGQSFGFIRAGAIVSMFGDPGKITVAFDINNQDQIVGQSNNHAVFYENQILYDLNNLTIFSSSGVSALVSAVAINDAGWIIGTDSSGAGFLLTPNTSTVPIPGTFWLFGPALVGLGVASR
jgi:hypothetical protein